MPTARRNGCLASVGKNVYYSGSYYMDTANQQRMEMLIGTPIVTSAPTFAPTLAPCAVTAPTNGALGTCTGSLALGGTCQFSCNDGYGVSGPTSCSATGVLAAATCRTGAWTTRKAVPAMSYMPAQGAGTYDTFMYTYIAGGLPSPANRGEFYKYASTADIWTTGGTKPPCAGPGCPERAVPRVLARASLGWAIAIGGRACGAACGLGVIYRHTLSTAQQYPFHAWAFLPCWAAVCVRAAMKCPERKLYFMASARVGDAMYFLSGDEGPPVPAYPGYISKYSTLTDTWTSASKAPTWGVQRANANSGNQHSGAGAVGTRIYYVGSTRHPNIPVALTTYGRNEVYETFTDSWTTKKEAPIVVAQGTAVAVKGNRVYAFSALYPGPAKVFVYDATTDVWTSRALPLLALVALGSVGSAGRSALR